MTEPTTPAPTTAHELYRTWCTEQAHLVGEHRRQRRQFRNDPARLARLDAQYELDVAASGLAYRIRLAALALAAQVTDLEDLYRVWLERATTDTERDQAHVRYVCRLADLGRQYRV